MFMNLVSSLIKKPIVIYALFTVLLSAIFSLSSSFFLPSSGVFIENSTIKNNDKVFDISYAFDLQTKEIKVAVKKSVVSRSSKVLVLKEFNIIGTFLSKDEEMVLIKDAKGGVFLSKGEVHKGYKLMNVYIKKAKFKKGIDYYWAFINALDEKEFLENKAETKSTVSSKTIKPTSSKKMFEEIKVKNGKYFIPKDMLEEYSDLSKIGRSVSAMVYNINGKMTFKVTRILSSSVFYKLGIRKNDFIIAINNQEIKSLTEPLKYFQNMQNIKQLSITVKRNNQKKELKYEVY